MKGAVELQKRLKRLAMEAQAMNTSAVAGYAAPHTVYVHEDLTMEHQPGKQGKFLEGPARALGNQIVDVVVEKYKQTNSPPKALLTGARFLLKETQPLVPVQTGSLLASGFACLGSEEEVVAAKAEARSIEILEAAE